MTLCQPKMQPHTKFGIPSSNNIQKNALNIIILKTRSEVTVTVTQKWYATLGHPKKHPHTKFGIHTSKNIEVMQILETRSEVKITVTPNGTGQPPIPRSIYTPNLGFLTQIIKDICSRYNYCKNEVRGQV